MHYDPGIAGSKINAAYIAQVSECMDSVTVAIARLNQDDFRNVKQMHASSCFC